MVKSQAFAIRIDWQQLKVEILPARVSVDKVIQTGVAGIVSHLSFVGDVQLEVERCFRDKGISQIELLVEAQVYKARICQSGRRSEAGVWARLAIFSRVPQHIVVGEWKVDARIHQLASAAR